METIKTRQMKEKGDQNVSIFFKAISGWRVELEQQDFDLLDTLFDKS
jgi:hypothetical protein